MRWNTQRQAVTETIDAFYAWQAATQQGLPSAEIAQRWQHLIDANNEMVTLFKTENDK